MPAAVVASMPTDILHLILGAVDTMEKDRQQTLLTARTMTRNTYPHASSLLFGSTHIASTSKFASMLAVLHETNIGDYIDELVIGRIGRQRAHTTHKPLLEASPSTLVAILESKRLPRLQTVRVGEVDWRGAFSLVAGAQTPDDARPSYIVVVSDEPSLTPVAGGEAVLECINAPLIVPKKSAWGGKAQPGVLMGLPVVYASVIHFERAVNLADLDMTFPPGCTTAGLYAGSVAAWGVFRQLLLIHGTALRTLTVSWTTGSALNRHRTPEMSAALGPGISACVHLQHLTLGLFLGSAATVSIRSQWRAVIVILAAVNPIALRTVTLVVTIHEDGDLAGHLDGLRDLPWFEAESLLRPERCPAFKAVAYKVLGVRPGSDAAEAISLTMKESLYCTPVQGSKEPLFATRSFPG